MYTMGRDRPDGTKQQGEIAQCVYVTIKVYIH